MKGRSPHQLIINYSELDMKTMQAISMAVSNRLQAELGRSMEAAGISGILLRFDVNVEITADGRFFLHHDKRLEAAVKYLSANF